MPRLPQHIINPPARAAPGNCTLDTLIGREHVEQLILLDGPKIEQALLRNASRYPPSGFPFRRPVKDSLSMYTDGKRP